MYVSLRDNPAYNWWVVLFLLVGLYLVSNLALPYIGDPTVETYVVRPILWGLVAWAVLTFPKYRASAKLRLRNSLFQLGLMIALFQIAALVTGGLFSGFGRSPYSFTPLGIVTNLFSVGLTLIGVEISRAWLVKRLKVHHTFFVIVLATLLFTLLSIPLATLIAPREPLQVVSYVNSRALPLLAENLLASYLALLAGPLAAIAYRGTLQAFWWFCPILPDLTWAFLGLIGTGVPIIGLVVVNRYYASQTQPSQPRRVREGSLARWIIITILAVAIIWFSVGIFPVHPAVVAGTSMKPTMDVGDVAIIAKVSAHVVKQGDIIQFRKEEVTVMHRVVEVQETEAAKLFITKGDAMDNPDRDPVIPENVVGKAMFTIPKIGWAAIVIKGFFTGKA